MPGYIPVSIVRKDLYKIAEAARLTKSTPRALRWYEKLGLLPSTKRIGGRIRLYTQQELAQISEIKKLQEEGKTLAEIKLNFATTKKSMVSKTKIKIFIDSTFSLSLEDLPKNDLIEIVPMNIEFGFYKYKDLTAITPGTMAEMEKKKRKLAKSSPPTEEEYLKLFEKAVAQDYQVISLHPDSRISGSYASALHAAQKLGALPIKVIDTKLLALGFYFVFVQICQTKDVSLAKIEKILKEVQDKVTEIVIINSLERLGIEQAEGILRELFNFVPIIQHTARAGLEPIARVNDLKEAITYLQKQQLKRVTMVAGYSDQQTQAALRKLENITKTYAYSAVVTANLGRSLAGLAVKTI